MLQKVYVFLIKIIHGIYIDYIINTLQNSSRKICVPAGNPGTQNSNKGIRK